MQQWPINPVNVIVRGLANQYQSSVGESGGEVMVADFGCGDAELAKKLLKTKGKGGKCPFVVHSFDLVACCDLVTACDMANVPLPNQSVDVGVFCLALMGTNLADFVREAHRVLKPNGILKIAEVRSRFESTDHNQKRKNELEEFLKVLQNLGFECVKKDRSNKMFVLLELQKSSTKPDTKLTFTAKPCIYKRR